MRRAIAMGLDLEDVQRRDLGQNGRDAPSLGAALEEDLNAGKAARNHAGALVLGPPVAELVHLI